MVGEIGTTAVGYLCSTKAKTKDMLAHTDRLQTCWFIAHRGFSAKAPENTLRAIKKAVTLQVDAVEFDVRLSKDNVVVVLHDSSVNRTTDGKGKVQDLSLVNLKKLDAGTWKHQQFSGEPIPTLSETLAYLATTSCKAVIEIKDNTALDYVLADVKKVKPANQVYLLSPDHNVLTQTQAVLPRSQCAWLCDALPKEYVSPLRQAEWIKVQLDKSNTTILDAHYGILSSELIGQLHAQGITVWTWTVNDPNVMKTLQHWGVDAITTDHPDWKNKI